MTNRITQLFSRGSGRKNGSPARESDELIEFAVRHFRRDFPNSARVDCPSPAELLDLIKANELPGERLRAHLITCSECYDYFQSELAVYRNMVRAAALESDRRRPLPMMRSLVAFTCILLIVGALGVLMRWNRDAKPESSQVVNDRDSASIQQQANQQTQANAHVTPADTPSPLAVETPPSGTRQSKNLLATNIVNIDLESLNSRRRPNEVDAKRPRFTKSVNRVIIKLPAGSLRGIYSITLADVFGKSLRLAQATSKDGNKLELKLDFSQVKPGKYLICVTYANEVPECSPATITPAP